MSYTLKTCLLYTFCLALALLSISKVRAQQKIKLGKVAKMQFFAIGPAAWGGEWAIEAVPENNVWQRYQTLKSDQFGENRTKQRIYINRANKNDLKALLKIANKSDTLFRVQNFGINKKQLIKYIDSISYQTKLPVTQREPFIRFLMSDDSLQKALVRWLKISGHPDFSYQTIYIITTTNDTIKVCATNTRLYCLPWYINDKVNYNPKLAMLFTNIIYSKSNVAYEYREFYKELCRCAYMVCFHANRSLKFFWYNLPQVSGDFKEVK